MVTFSNAKINVGLFVTGKRDDGYHNLESLFFPIALCDGLELLPAVQNEISIYGREIPGDTANNSCLKALELMQERYNVQPYHIRVQKKLPTGAGIGGGSSNATFTLRLINQLEGLNLSNQELEALALEIGSDNPFFVDNTAKFVTGRGEVMQPCTMNLSGLTVAMVYPSVHMGTGEAYKNVTFTSPTINLQQATKEELFAQPELFINSFQAYFIEKNPEIRQIFTELNNLKADFVSLSGSGSTVYGIYQNETDFTALQAFCTANNYEFFETKIL